MKTTKCLIFAALLAVVTFASAQNRVGIGIKSPEGALDVWSTDSGVVLPRLDNTAAVTAPVDGMMIYDKSTTCVKAYQNGAWSDCLSDSGTGTLSSDCDNNGFTGSYTSGVALSGATFSVAITNSTIWDINLNFQNSDLSLSGVSGVSVSNVSPALMVINSGQSQLVTYTLTGTPTSSGTLQADWSNSSLSCSATTLVLGTISSDCDNNGFAGTYTNGVALSGTTFSVTITNDTSSAANFTFQNSDISLSGVSGVSVRTNVVPASATIASGQSQLVTYKLRGTPGSSGTLQADWSNSSLSCSATTPVEGILSSDCNTNGFAGSYTNGTALSGASFSVTITNDTSSAVNPTFQNSDLSLSGVSGVSVSSTSPTSPTINAGQSRLITYTLTGTPTSSGTLQADWSNSSLSCSATTPVAGILSSDCNTNGFAGSYTNGTALSGASFSVTITNDTSSAVNPTFQNSDLSLSGVSGVSVSSTSPTSPTINAGQSRLITYTLTGTPGSSGTLQADWSNSSLSCSATTPVAGVLSSDCNTNGFAGSYTNGTALSGASFSVTITNDTSSAVNPTFQNSDLSLSGVSGVSVSSTSPTSPTINAGQSQLITYTLTGTPGSSGTLQADWSNSSLSCSATTPVEGILSSDCNTNGFAGSYTNGTALSGASFSVTITNDTSSAVNPTFQNSDLSLSGVSGVSVSSTSPTSPTINAGQSQLITYTLTGTPGSSGTLQADWSNSSLSCSATTPVEGILSSDCNTNGFAGSYTNGTALSGASFSVTITNDTSSAVNPTFQNSDLSLSGVSGVSVSSTSPTSPTINVGQSRLITYTLTGTPGSSGTLQADWSNSSLSCSATTPVAGVLSSDCNTNGFAGSYTNGVTLSGASFSVTITNDTSSAVNPTFQNSDLSLSGVSGVSVSSTSPTSPTINAGQSRLITYTLTGTPGSSGTLQADWSNSSLSCSATTPVAGILSSDCNTNGFAGSYTNGTALSGATFSVTITNDTSSAVNPTFQNSDLSLSGVSGVSVSSTSPTSPTINAGQSRLITYTLTGTPGSSGTLQADWSNSSLSCSATTPVAGVLSSDCNTNGFAGSYTNGVTLSGATFSVTITNDTSSAANFTFQKSDLNLSGVSGINIRNSVTPASATIAPGQSQLVTYSLRDTPTSSGTLQADWSNSGLSCSATTPVAGVLSSDCNTNGFAGSYTNGVELSGASFSVTITNDTSSAANFTFQRSDLNLSGVSGITVRNSVTPASATIAPGQSQLVTYGLRGTPGSSGTLQADWSNSSLSCSATTPVEGVLSSDCNTNGFTGTYTNGVALSGATFSVTITNDTSSAANFTFQRSDLNLSGVSGINIRASVTPASATIAPGQSQLVTYSLRDTPTSSGTLQADWSNSGLSCSATTPVAGVLSSDCNTNGFAGSYTNGTALSGATFSVTITNDTSSAVNPTFQNSDLSLSGVSGVSVSSTSPTSPTINAGQSRLITYTLTGTPTSSGTLQADWSNSSLSCSATTPVAGILSSDCNTNGFTGTYTNGTALSGATFSVTITNDTSSAVNPTFQNSDLSLSGVSGVSVSSTSPTSPTINAGQSRLITYTLTGTPGSSGTLQADWSNSSLSCSATTPVAGTISSDCNTNGFAGTYKHGTALSGATFSVTITNGTSSAVNLSFQNSDLSLSGVSGVSVSSTSPTSPTINAGQSRLITYTLTGTPTSSGALQANWSNSGMSCSATTTVISNGDATFALPETVTIVSAFHQGPPLVDIQGILDNGSNKVIVEVSYTGGSGDYDAYTSAPLAVTGEDGDTNNITISYSAGTFSNTGTVSVTVTVDGDGSFNVPQQGLGVSAIFATLDFQVNGNSKGNILLEAIGGIPDREFGDGIHDFIYLPIKAEDNNTWLSHNLGASYTDMNDNANFNPAQKATGYNDHLAYGSFYQWGRLSDEHELINWSSSTVGSPENGSTFTNANVDVPLNDLFIIENGSIVDWRLPQNNSLWQGEAGINNPCPEGYRLPTGGELSNLLSAASISNSSRAASSRLGLTSGGFRHLVTAAVTNSAITGSYWSSTVNGTESRHLNLSSNSAFVASNSRTYGFSVRCIKD